MRKDTLLETQTVLARDLAHHYHAIENAETMTIVLETRHMKKRNENGSANEIVGAGMTMLGGTLLVRDGDENGDIVCASYSLLNWNSASTTSVIPITQEVSVIVRSQDHSYMHDDKFMYLFLGYIIQPIHWAVEVG